MIFLTFLYYVVSPFIKKPFPLILLQGPPRVSPCLCRRALNRRCSLVASALRDQSRGSAFLPDLPLSSGSSLFLRLCICCVSWCCCSGAVRCAVISRRSAGARSPRCSRRGCCSRWCAATPRTLSRRSSAPSTASTTPKIAWVYGEFGGLRLFIRMVFCAITRLTDVD